MNNDEASLIRRLMKRLDELEANVKSARNQNGQNVSLPGQYPGKPIPHTEGVEITIPVTTNVQSGNITISADGPFYAHRIVCHWRPTAGANLGFWRPNSSVEDWGLVDPDVIDFYWEYIVSGSHRNRQNIGVPSAGLTRAERGNGGWELAVPDVFQPTSTITIKVTPTIAPQHAGSLYFGFHGYYELP